MYRVTKNKTATMFSLKKAFLVLICTIKENEYKLLLLSMNNSGKYSKYK